MSTQGLKKLLHKSLLAERDQEIVRLSRELDRAVQAAAVAYDAGRDAAALEPSEVEALRSQVESLLRANEAQDAEIERLVKERDLAIEHDRGVTAQRCKDLVALTDLTCRAERAESALAAAEARAEEAERQLSAFREHHALEIQVLHDRIAELCDPIVRAKMLESPPPLVIQLASPSAPSPREGAESERAKAVEDAIGVLDRIVFTEVRGLETLTLSGPERDDWIVRATARKVIGLVRGQIRSLLSSPSAPTPEEGDDAQHSRGCKRSLCAQGMFCPEQHRRNAAAPTPSKETP